MKEAGSAVKSHLKKHKVKHGIGCGVIITVAVVLGVVLGTVAAVVVYNKNKEETATKKQQADSAKAASAAVNLGEISVLPPKGDDDGTASRRLAGDVYASIVKTLTSALSDSTVGRTLRGLDSADGKPIDTASFDELSDYKTTTTATSVDDGMSQTMRVPNMIICMLSQTKAEKFFNAGPYIANVDENKCQTDSDSQEPRITPVSFD